MTERVVTVEEMRAAERAAMDAGTSELTLMQRAGEGAAQWVHRIAAGRDVCVLCGPGNNGGDGYVIAESLRRRGYSVSVIAPREAATETARRARDEFAGPVETGGRIDAAVLVDCLFGYGLSRRVEGEFAELLEDASASHCIKIAIDVPSMVDSISGDMLGPVVRYDLTVALGAWKPAHFLMPAMGVMGARRLVPLGLSFPGNTTRLSSRPSIAAPAVDSHKYRRGLLAVVAGEMPGAPLLACEAAMRAGAGYVKLLSGHSHPDVPADLVIDGRPIGEALSDERIDAILVGPGLGRGDEARARLCAVLEAGRPCVLDADALHLLDDDLMEGIDASRIVVTPHEGELAALCAQFGVAGEGKLELARGLHAATGLTILAKGPDTICVGDGQTVFFPAASSWLSVAGSGDVLAGILASRLAHHRNGTFSCEEAVWLHAEAARKTAPCFTAGELALAVRPAMASFL